MRENFLVSILRINRLRVKQLKAELLRHDFVGVMHLILLYADRHPGASQRDAAEFYALDPASVARDAQRLEEGGYLRREADPDDRRRQRLYTTEKAGAILALIHAVNDDFAARITADLTAEERETLTALLSRMADKA